MAKRRVKRMMMRMPGIKWRVSLSVVVGIGWLIFLVLWLFFYASNFTIYQNIAVFIASVLAVAMIMGASWASWGMSHGWEIAYELEKEERKRKPRRKKK
jgi:uncharacterized membrane protein